MRYSRNTEETNFWAGYADCMLALFMIALLLWIVSSGITVFSNADKGDIITLREVRIAELEEGIKILNGQLLAKDQEIKDLQQRLKEFSDWESRLAELEKLRAENSKLKTQLAELESENEKLKKESGDYQEKLRELANRFDVISKKFDTMTKALNGGTIDDLIANMQKLEKELNDKPPIINLTEGAAREFLFPSGKADLPSTFSERLRNETFPELQKVLINYQRIDTLEIVGHTDGSPIVRKGNLDTQIPKLLDGTVKEGTLSPGSNTDLGLMRALAIRNEWNEWLLLRTDDEQIRLKQINVRCYSAAQTVPVKKVTPNFDWLAEDASARRIEIRFLQLGSAFEQLNKE